tara:strand:- start:78 stop:230 length:153 start_codon:yes stop_codon:yes gene_type:complete
MVRVGGQSVHMVAAVDDALDEHQASMRQEDRTKKSEEFPGMICQEEKSQG